MPTDFGKILASWRVTEYEKHARSRSWYIIVFALGLLLLVYALWTLNYLFIVIIFIAGFIVVMQERTEPLPVLFQITTKGITIGKKRYGFSELKSFWILYEPPAVQKLYIDFKSSVQTTLMIPLKKQNPLKIHEILIRFLEEDLEMEDEPFSETLGRLLKM